MGLAFRLNRVLLFLGTVGVSRIAFYRCIYYLCFYFFFHLFSFLVFTAALLVFRGFRITSLLTPSPPPSSAGNLTAQRSAKVLDSLLFCAPKRKETKRGGLSLS